MASFNKVILMGNLTRDPETRFAQSGTAVVNFGLAVNERFQGSDGQWQDRPTFIDITMFGKRGEAFAKFHSKGKPAFIEGKLRLDSWEDKSGGGKRSKLYVVADSWEFCGGGREGGGGGGGGYDGGGHQQSGGGGGDTWGGDAAFEESMSDTPF
jgi:single-strand DNA-binding protein